jgi:hypothetical protein
MGTDDIQVFDFLKSCPNTYISANEIARRVGGRKRLRENPDWIRPVLRRMISEELIETDEYGGFRLKMRERTTKVLGEKLTMDNWQTWELVLEEKKQEEPQAIAVPPPPA